jgi:hypothetical protein
MRSRATRLIIATCAALTVVSCNTPRSQTEPAQAPTEYAEGTAGVRDEPISMSGCVTRVEPDGYVLTSIDDALERHTGAAGHHTDDPKSRPQDASRGAENERARSDQNVSPEFGRFRLTGNAVGLATYVDREVDLRGRVVGGDSGPMPHTISVESIRPTGAACGAKQERGNDRGNLPGQDLPRKLRE